MKTIALVGKKLSHSFSKSYFESKFEKLGISNEYQYINLELENMNSIYEKLNLDKSIIGFNVTIPYKQNVIPLLNELDDSARKISAVNTVKVFRENEKIKLVGFNTDAYGFQFSVKPFLNIHHQKALILGTGGAAKAVEYSLKNLGIDVLFVSRNKQNSNTVLYQDINDFAIRQYKFIVNCTPLGMYPNVDEVLPIPHDAITSEHLCVDLIYNPEETNFIRKAKQNGAIAINGLSMLHLQANKAFEIFIS